MPSTKSKPTPKHSWRFQAIGTEWEIVSTLPIHEGTKKAVEVCIESFDKTYSRFRADSLVSRIGNTPGEYTFPESAAEIFSFYDDLWRITERKVTPLIGATLVATGYDANYSLQPQTSLPTVPGYQEVLRRSEATLTTDTPVLIDIGAVGKGYLVDQVSEIMKRDGHTSFVVDGSGDLNVIDCDQAVGLENPFDTSEVIGVIELDNRALCASASNRRAWGEWHHIVDPTTNTPVKDIVATWVIADSAMIADGLATALFFVSPQTLATQYQYEYARVHADGSIEYSEYFKKGIYT